MADDTAQNLAGDTATNEANPVAKKKSAPKKKRVTQKSAVPKRPRKRVKSPSTTEPIEPAVVPLVTAEEEFAGTAPPTVEPEVVPKEEKPIEPEATPKPSEPSWDDLVQDFSSKEDEQKDVSSAPINEDFGQPQPEETKTEETKVEEPVILEPGPESKPESESEPPTLTSYEDFSQKNHISPPSADEKILPEERFSATHEFEATEAVEETHGDAETFSMPGAFNLKKIIKYFVIFAVVAGGVIFYFCGGKDLIFKPSIQPPQQELPQKQEIIPDKDFVTAVIDTSLKTGEGENILGADNLTPYLQNAYTIGTQTITKNVNTGINTAIDVGSRKPLFEDNVFKKYVRVFNELRNATNTDIYSILNNSTDRAAELSNQLALLEDTYKRAQDQLDLITKEITSLKSDFKNIQEPRNNAEKTFFEDLKNGLPNESFDKLTEYILILQKQDEIKARHNALNNLSDYYKILLKKAGVRIEDMKKNRDALVQGVRVYEVPGSNVDVIIKNQQSKTSTSGLDSTGGLTIIPAEPVFPTPKLQPSSQSGAFDVPEMGSGSQ